MLDTIHDSPRPPIAPSQSWASRPQWRRSTASSARAFQTSSAGPNGRVRASDVEIEAALPIFAATTPSSMAATRIYPGVVEGLAEMRAMGFALAA